MSVGSSVDSPVPSLPRRVCDRRSASPGLCLCGGFPSWARRRLPWTGFSSLWRHSSLERFLFAVLAPLESPARRGVDMRCMPQFRALRETKYSFLHYSIQSQSRGRNIQVILWRLRAINSAARRFCFPRSGVCAVLRGTKRFPGLGCSSDKKTNSYVIGDTTFHESLPQGVNEGTSEWTFKSPQNLILSAKHHFRYFYVPVHWRASYLGR